MKFIFILLLIFNISCSTKKVFNAPFKSGCITFNNFTGLKYAVYQKASYVNFEGSVDSLFSVSQGKVVLVNNVPDEDSKYNLYVKYKNLLIVYNEIDSLKVNINEYLYQGQFIGLKKNKRIVLNIFRNQQEIKDSLLIRKLFINDCF